MQEPEVRMVVQVDVLLAVVTSPGSVSVTARTFCVAFFLSSLVQSSLLPVAVGFVCTFQKTALSLTKSSVMVSLSLNNLHPGLSSELQTPRVTRHGSFLLSLPLRRPPRRIPQPRIWASSASPIGLQFGGLYLRHSTVLPTTSPHCFSLRTGCMTRPSPTKVSPRGPGSTAGNLKVEARPKRGPGLARPLQIMPWEAGSVEPARGSHCREPRDNAGASEAQARTQDSGVL
ncbi:unnamed protein product [Rangifer tarandus platyrhynchus]|uniref:Uncharacterized protein n=1 Tax=Rangifer tarandus platyrhynchus TaxID=3082113 RepID=A0AC59YQA5_RANTA